MADQAIRELILQKNYPCVPALRSLQSGEYMIGLYQDFGSGLCSHDLLKDLLKFREVQKATSSVYMSFWAIFDGQREYGEVDFEERLWKELSYLSAHEEFKAPWDPNFSDDPSSPKFCLSIAGEAFFIVGLHPNSSRLARQFQYPSIVFNLYDQFEELDRRGQYQAVVATNRKRELKFQGSLNPMVEKHGDKWEAIQFSGRENDANWKCPFHHGLIPPHLAKDQK